MAEYPTKHGEYVSNNGRQASTTAYSSGTIKARPKWNSVKKYLLGEMNWQPLNKN